MSKVKEPTIYDTMPKGWRVINGATTAPQGYIWICNGKSRFGGEYKNGLLPVTALPILCKDNAEIGGYYQFAGGYQIVHEIYSLTPEYAAENDFMYLDRVVTSAGDFALPGSAIRN